MREEKESFRAQRSGGLDRFPKEPRPPVDGSDDVSGTVDVYTSLLMVIGTGCVCARARQHFRKRASGFAILGRKNTGDSPSG